MSAGELIHRGQLQTRAADLNALNERVGGWLPSSEFWCRVTPLAGRELVAAQQKFAEVTHRVKMYFRPGVSTDQRFVFKGRAFDIGAAINEDEANIYLFLYCTEGVNDGD